VVGILVSRVCGVRVGGYRGGFRFPEKRNAGIARIASEMLA